MSESPALSEAEVQSLLSQGSISSRFPWGTNDEETVEAFYKSVCEELGVKTGASSRIEWNHYGSGYASFIDAWFYKPTPDFAVPSPVRYGSEHMGLVVLLSRLSPYFVVMEGAKHWHAHGGSSYLPSFAAVDHLSSPGVIELAAQVVPLLESKGLLRLHREQLSAGLPLSARVPTILQDGPYCQFDALYYWED